MSGEKKQNPWIAHVKKVAEEKGVGYREALRMPETKESYNKRKL
jgi:hypothetical protein